MTLDDIRAKILPYLGTTPEAHRAAMARLEEDAAAVIAEIEEDAVLKKWRAMPRSFHEKYETRVMPADPLGVDPFPFFN